MINKVVADAQAALHGITDSFGMYRIGIGVIILLMIGLGIDLQLI